MADRGTLSKALLQEFTEFMTSHGWKHSPGKGEYQMAQFRKPNNDGSIECLIVFNRDRGKHFTVLNKYHSLVKQFCDSRKLEGEG